ncbi:MAG: hypothetical protein IKW39_06255 [Alphaproteobacteria bacterium]|nr:hypothetical protein [Alphaproteobacteria bacterium]
MKDLLKDIEELDYASAGPLLKLQDIKETNDILHFKGYPKLPSDVIFFLQSYNGLRTERGVIWGIDTKNHTFYDIVAENLVSSNPNPKDILILGNDDKSYVGYNQNTKKYVILENSGYQEIFSSKSFANIVRQCLKIYP